MRRAKKIRDSRKPRRRADRHPVPEVAEQFVPLERAVRRITERTAESRNAVDIFHDGDEAYPAMLAAIAEARSSVALSTYIMHDDPLGGRFVEVLAAAVKRVASLPVPAVVGMQITGRAATSAWAGTLKLRILVPAGAAARIAMALAVSIGLPPPKPIRQS